jgi:hypothetical protein
MLPLKNGLRAEHNSSKVELMAEADQPTPALEPEPGGNIFLPVHALQLEEDRVNCHGLTFARVDGQTWSTLESLWMRDQEMDIWLNQERVFAIMPFTEEIKTVHDPAFAHAFEAYAAIVTAARLVAPGVWIDAQHIAPVARTNNGINARVVSSDRPRLWASVFGDALKVRGRCREWGARVECRPLQYHLPHGPAYLMNVNRAANIESTITVLGELQALAPNHAWWIAHRSFQRGHDLFLSRRLRLTALFGAFEAIFGPFHREKGDPGIGVAVKTVLDRAGWEAEDPVTYVEKTLRPARNRLAHGSDVAMPMDFASVETNLLDLLRSGLAFASAWIRGLQQPDGPIAPGPARTLIEFQRWSGRVVADED